MADIQHPFTCDLFSTTHTDSHSSFSDYQYASSSVSFASGLSVGDIRCISVFVTDDTTVEVDEIFYVDFGRIYRSGITVNPVASSASITILDDDGEYNS